MAGGAASRFLIIKKNATALAGVNSKSIAVASEPIDVTTDEDGGVRCLLGDAGTETIDISGSGITKDVLLRGIMMDSGSKLLTDITVEFPKVGAQASTGDVLSGNFYLTSYTDNGGGSDGAIEFDFAMQSSGQWTRTAGA